MGVRQKIIWAKDEVKNLWDNLWTIPREQLPKQKSRILYLARVVVDTLQSYRDRRIGFQAAALSYQCMVTLIPMVAVFLAVTSGLGVSETIKDLVFEKLNVGSEITDMVLLAAENIVSASGNGLFGFISIISFLWSIIWLFMRVEVVFNNVWNVTKIKRNIFRRFGVDVILLITVPFVILIFFAGSVVYSHLLDLLFPSIPGITEYVKSFVSWLILGGIVVLTLTSMFKFIPATTVLVKNAFIAALISGTVFTLLQYLYLETQIFVTKLNTFYGTIAAIPLFMIWLSYSWRTVLYGAQLSCALQNVDAKESDL